jgi:hypothetical protein
MAAAAGENPSGGCFPVRLLASRRNVQCYRLLSTRGYTADYIRLESVPVVGQAVIRRSSKARGTSQVLWPTLELPFHDVYVSLIPVVSTSITINQSTKGDPSNTPGIHMHHYQITRAGRHSYRLGDHAFPRCFPTDARWRYPRALVAMRQPGVARLVSESLDYLLTMHLPSPVYRFYRI